LHPGKRSEEVKPIRVVVVGGGFAAVQFAKALRGKLPASECEILLFNHENHMVFHPLLADVAGTMKLRCQRQAVGIV
jgi:NADH dehydrogenase FAD-containing subunit